MVELARQIPDSTAAVDAHTVLNHYGSVSHDVAVADLALDTVRLLDIVHSRLVLPEPAIIVVVKLPGGPLA